MTEEERKINNFKKKHEGCIRNALYLQIKGVMPLEGPFSITKSLSSGIGPSVIIRCNGCGDLADVTDYDCW